MKRILATTALALVISGGAYTAMSAQIGSYQSQQNDVSASDFIDMRIYATENVPTGNIQPGGEKEWDDVGEVNDVVFDQQGQIKAAIVGVGGFLGIGEKNVAIPMQDIKFVRSGDDASDYFLVINANKDTLTNAAAWVSPEQKASEQQAAQANAQQDAVPGATSTTDTTAANGTMNTDSTAAATDTAATATDSTAATTDTAATSTTATPATPATTDTAATTSGTATTDTTAAGTTTSDTAQAPASSTDTTTTSSTNGASTMTDDGRTPLTRPEVTREGYAELPADQLTADQLQGATVYGANDENVATINRLILSTDGKVERVVLDVGGFLGMGAREIAVTMDELNIVKNSNGDDVRVYIDSDQADLKAQPEFKG